MNEETIMTVSTFQVVEWLEDSGWTLVISCASCVISLGQFSHLQKGTWSVEPQEQDRLSESFAYVLCTRHCFSNSLPRRDKYTFTDLGISNSCLQHSKCLLVSVFSAYSDFFTMDLK